MSDEAREPGNKTTESSADAKKSGGGTKALAVIVVIIAFSAAGYQLYNSIYSVPFDPQVVNHTGDGLYLVTIGDVGADAIDVAKANIERVYPELGEMEIIGMPLPEEAKVDLGPGTRPPYSADKILLEMEELAKDYPGLSKAMAIIEEPLFSEEAGTEMDIWGLTSQVGGNYGVASTTLKRAEIEQDGITRGTKDYANEFDLSLGKSVLHEFGHLMGLNHCNRGIGCPEEVMSPSSAVEEGGNVLCAGHKKQLAKLYELWEI